MSLTESTMMALGSSAPNFTLPSTDGKLVSLEDFSSANVLVILFICNHCPYVVHIAPALSQLAKKYSEQGVAFIAINSNDIEAYPADSFEKMKEEKAARDYIFPYLLDESQSVAKRYQAACTPDIYAFNSDQKLAYRGQFDSTRPHRVSSGNYDARDGQADGSDLAQAIDLLLAGEAVPEQQIPSMGCNIKWKPGNSPDYYG